MSDTLERFRQGMTRDSAMDRIPASRERLPEPTAEEEDSCPAFGYLRGIRDRALMIEFRRRNGNHFSFPYSWIGPVVYNPSAGLLLRFVGDETTLVLIEGRNLNALVKEVVNLYDRGIQRHRITWVREMERDEAERAKSHEIAVERFRLHRIVKEGDTSEVEWLRPFDL